MLDYLQQNWQFLVIVFVAVIGYFVYLLKTKGEEVALAELKHSVLELMILAQKKFGDENGQLKFDWVADRIYNVMPAPAKFFLTEEDLRDFIQDVYESVKDMLDDDEEVK